VFGGLADIHYVDAIISSNLFPQHQFSRFGTNSLGIIVSQHADSNVYTLINSLFAELKTKRISAWASIFTFAGLEKSGSSTFFP
jgi:hypothetical protein